MIFIRTTPEQLWTALTSADFTRKYWFGTHQNCQWEAGSGWELQFAHGRIADRGEIIEIERPKRLSIKWRNEFRHDQNSSKPSPEAGRGFFPISRHCSRPAKSS